MIDQGITSLDTGASDITYTGNEGPKSPEQEEQMLMALLQEEYDKYVFEMEEQGIEPMSMQEFIEQAVAEGKMGSRGPVLPNDPTEPVNPFQPKPIGPLPDRQMAAVGGIMGLDQRRQYGLGSKLKRALGKITRPFKKVAQKLMPKELAGIARMGAPFLAASGIPYAALYGGALSAAGQAKQSGKIGLLETLMSASPGLRFKGGAGAGQFKITGVGGETGAGRNTLRDLFLRGEQFTPQEMFIGEDGNYYNTPQMGYDTTPRTFDYKSRQPIFGETGQKIDKFLYGSAGDPGKIQTFDQGAPLSQGKGLQTMRTGLVEPTKGLLGSGGDYGILGLGEANSSQLADVLIGGKEGLDKSGVSKLKLGSWAIGIVSGIQAGKYADEQAAADAAESQLLATNQAASDAEVQAARAWAIETFSKMSIYADGGRINRNMGGGFEGLGSMQRQDVTPPGMELDLRVGGFIPIGAQEKADDVKARVSKNEFVFTADAVKAAGGGSVNEGAKRMYDTMKRLESQVG